MITTTISSLVNAEAPLRKLSEARLSVKAAYAIKRLLDVISSDLSFYHAERARMFAEWGMPVDGQPDQTAIKPEHEAAFLDRVQTILGQPVELSAAALDLMSLDGHVELSAVDILLLGPFVTVPDA